MGSVLHGSLLGSTKQVSPTRPEAGETITYTVTLQNPGPVLAGARVTDTLPSGVTYAGDLWASAGSYGESGGVITWTGDVPAGSPVVIGFSAVVDAGITDPTAIVNAAVVNDGLGNVLSRQATVIVDGYAVFMPVVMR